jgi:hypothetical protein
MSLLVSQTSRLIAVMYTENVVNKDANMVAFNKAIYKLITMAFLILVGNTCYPIVLRLIVWSIRKVLPENERWKNARHTLKFLLDHPRRCYTNLFPSEHTWFLLWSVIILNGIDCTAFAVLNVCRDSPLSHQQSRRLSNMSCRLATRPLLTCQPELSSLMGFSRQ